MKITKERILNFGLGALALYLAYRFGWTWYFDPASSIPIDFNVYWRAAERLSNGQEIYVPADGSAFKYSAVFAYFFRFSFFLFEKNLAASLWMSLSAFTWVLALRLTGLRLLSLSTRSHQESDARLFFGVLVLSIALSWRGWIETLSYGQADLFLGALLLFTYLAPDTTSQKKSNARYVLATILLLIKPHLALVFLPVFLARPIRQGLAEALKMFLLGIALYALPLLDVGFAGLWRFTIGWWECIRTQDLGFVVSNLNQSMASILTRNHPELVNLLSGLLILTYLLVTVKIRNLLPRAPHHLTWAYGLSGYLVFSPLSWRWLVFLWVPIALFLFAGKNFKRTSLENILPFVVAFFAVFFAVLSHGVIARPLGYFDSEAHHYFGFFGLTSLSLWFYSISKLRQCSAP